jgi:bifunctional ADP-heptose synthase (sugar kinase/adenylyltransferase)
VTTAAILARFPALRALVVGDVCLDRWCRYHPGLAEPSRETGIPRIAVTATDVTPGAAGTVAANLAALGVGQVSVLGAIGDDAFGWELERSLAARSISTSLLIRSPLVSTFTYTKLLNASTGVEDLPRLDFINAAPLAPRLESQIVDSLRDNIRDFDVILVSDQAETSAGGVITARVRRALADLGGLGTATVSIGHLGTATASDDHLGTATVRERQPTDDATGDRSKVIWVDSRARCELFRNVILKVNRDEADAACQRIGGDYRALLDHTRSKLLVITHGADGALIVDHSDTWVRTQPIENPVDICGAGDSFSAGAAMALAVTGSPLEAAQFGNLVASLTIMQKGTGTATPAELLAAGLTEARP